MQQSVEDMRTKSPEEELAIAFGNAVNSSTFSAKTFAEAMMREHRTIQQSAMRAITDLIRHYADLPETHYDFRNQGTVELCREIRNKVFEAEPGAFLPHI